MKLLSYAASLVCLVVGIGSASGSLIYQHGQPDHQAKASLGEAMSASIHETIREAVAKALARKSKVASPVSLKDYHEAQPHFLAQRAASRAKAKQKTHDPPVTPKNNPYEPVKTLNTFDEELNPKAPLDRVSPGIENQKGFIFPPDYNPRVVYYSETADRPNPFPESYSPPCPKARQNTIVCMTSPDNWMDSKKFTCKFYEQALWCDQKGKPGSGWKKAFGSLADYAVDGVSAAEACCECGGGTRTAVVGVSDNSRLEDRRMLAPADRVPDPKARWFEKNDPIPWLPPRPLRRVQAPMDEVPMPYRQMAPLDTVTMRYSRYFRDIYEDGLKSDPRGFSMRYFSTPPKMCEAPLPVASASRIVRAIEFSLTAPSALLETNASSNGSSALGTGFSPSAFDRGASYAPVSIGTNKLDWPLHGMPPGGLWWAKFSGTLVVLDAGKYTLNLDVAFNTMSTLQVDGREVLTDGQCTVSKDEGICKAKKCKWDKASATCTAAGKSTNQTSTITKCPAATFQTSPVLFGCDPQAGTVKITIAPAMATNILTIPKGVSELDLSIKPLSTSDADVQVYDPKTNTWVVHYSQGVLNTQIHQGTYNGQYISFGGHLTGAESITFTGTVAQPLEVSVLNFGANPQEVEITYSYQGVKPCPGKDKVKGCTKLDKAAAQKLVKYWAQNLTMTYRQCAVAWQAVIDDYPGGQIRWYQWPRVWRAAYGPNPAQSALSDGAWQMGFAIVDADSDGYVTEAEYLSTCNSVAGAPGPSPAAVQIVDVLGTELNVCLAARVKGRSAWPADPFKGTGFHDDKRLDELVGHGPLYVREIKPKGVLLPSPDGTQNGAWFFPEGTYECVRRTAGAPPVYKNPENTVNTRGPAPSVANIVPEIVGIAAPGGPPLPCVIDGVPVKSPAPAAALLVENEDLNHHDHGEVPVTGSASAVALLDESEELYDYQGEEAPSPAAALLEEEELKPPAFFNSLDLTSGQHCIEVMLMVPRGAHDLKLTYSGPDTKGVSVVIPGQILHCDPVIQACSKPVREVCSKYRKKCPKAAPVPAPAPSPAAR